MYSLPGGLLSFRLSKDLYGFPVPLCPEESLCAHVLPREALSEDPYGISALRDHRVKS